VTLWYDDFSDGVADWSEWRDAGHFSIKWEYDPMCFGNARMWVDNDNFHYTRIQKWDAGPNEQNIEILARVFIGSWGTQTGTIYCHKCYARATGAGNVTDGYYLEFITNPYRLRIVNVTGGGTSLVAGSEYNFDFMYWGQTGSGTQQSANEERRGPVGEWYWYRWLLDGADHKYKVWKDGDPELASWNIEVTDASPVMQSGEIGMGTYDPYCDQRIDFIKIASGEALTAPTSPDDQMGQFTQAPLAVARDGDSYGQFTQVPIMILRDIDAPLGAQPIICIMT
jgi:hypothetical protein